MSGIRIGRVTEDYLSHILQNTRHMFSVGEYVHVHASARLLNLARTLSNVPTWHKSLLRHSARSVTFSVLVSTVLA